MPRLLDSDDTTVSHDRCLAARDRADREQRRDIDQEPFLRTRRSGAKSPTGVASCAWHPPIEQTTRRLLRRDQTALRRDHDASSPPGPVREKAAVFSVQLTLRVT